MHTEHAQQQTVPHDELWNAVHVLYESKRTDNLLATGAHCWSTQRCGRQMMKLEYFPNSGFRRCLPVFYHVFYLLEKNNLPTYSQPVDTNSR